MSYPVELGGDVSLGGVVSVGEGVGDGLGLCDGVGVGFGVVCVGFGVVCVGLGRAVGECPPGVGAGVGPPSLADAEADGEWLGDLSGDALGVLAASVRVPSALDDWSDADTAGRACVGPLCPSPAVTAKAVPMPPAASNAVSPVTATARRAPPWLISTWTKSYRTVRSAPDASRRAACQKLT